MLSPLVQGWCRRGNGLHVKHVSICHAERNGHGTKCPACFVRNAIPSLPYCTACHFITLCPLIRCAESPCSPYIPFEYGRKTTHDAGTSLCTPDVSRVLYRIVYIRNTGDSSSHDHCSSRMGLQPQIGFMNEHHFLRVVRCVSRSRYATYQR